MHADTSKPTSLPASPSGLSSSERREVLRHPFIGDATFTAPAKVIYPQANMGMGVEFSAVEPEQPEVLLKWLEELSAK